MRKFFLLALIILIVVITKMLGEAALIGNVTTHSTMVFGFILFSSYFFGLIASRFNLPSLTGYIFAGLLFGPYVFSGILQNFSLYSVEVVQRLQLLDNIALGLIAFTAGGEINFDLVRRRLKSILFVTGAQTIIVFLGVGIIFFIILRFFPINNLDTSIKIFGVAILLGMTSVAKSPATTIAIINEYQSKGPLTEIALGVTIIKDVVVIVCFALVLSVSKILLISGSTFDIGFLGKLLWEIFGSLGFGIILGYFMVWYIKSIKTELSLIVIGIAFLGVYVSYEAHLSGLLICMTAGFWVENFSEFGEELIHAVERHSLPIYVIFFTIAGASINLPALYEMWFLATILVIGRLVFTFIATWLGCRLSGESKTIQKYSWGAFVAQAGVTLGLATLIEKTFPGIGGDLKTLLVASIAINQIIGPVLFRIALSKAKEINLGK